MRVEAQVGQVIADIQPSAQGQDAARAREAAQPRPEPVQPDPAAQERMIQKLMEQFSKANLSIGFKRYGKANEMIAVEVTDRSTGKVVREIPAREIQALYSRMGETAGLIFDDTV
jgi:flagellar protein FlaG